MPAASPHAEEFARIVAAPEARLNLARAALSIARIDYPHLQPEPYLGRLDAMADAVRARLREGASPAPLDRVRELNRYLFVEEGFAGNAREYYDPRNSFLNEVLDRRLGIPATLSVVYMEVGWRLGLAFEGVPFPGHFLVKLHVSQGDVVLDPFYQGASLGIEDLAERARAAIGERESFEDLVPRILMAASKHQILTRLLGNLRAIYAGRQDLPRLLHVLSLLLVLEPEDAGLVQARAEAYQALGEHSAAAADWRRYLATLADDDEAERVRALIVELDGRPTRIH